MGRFVGIIFGAVALAACASFGSTPTPGTSDGGPGGGTEAGGDGSSSGSSGVSKEGGADPEFCASHVNAERCWDFEHGELVDGWEARIGTSTALSIAKGGDGRALHAAMRADVAFDYLSVTIPAGVTTITLSYDLLVSDVMPEGYAELIAFDTVSGPDVRIALTVNAGHAGSLSVEDSNSHSIDLDDLVAGERRTISMTYAPATGVMKVVSNSKSYETTMRSVSGDLRFGVGLVSVANGVPGGSFFFDDILLDY